jgi:hypothetical protein
MEPLAVIRTSKRKVALGLAICLGFIALGGLILTKGYPRDAWIGWLSLGLFGFALVVLVRAMMDSRPRLVIDEHGVFDRTLGVGVIPWAQIEDAYIAASFICLELRDPESFLQKLRPLKRRLARANRWFGRTELNLNLTGVAADPVEILEVVLGMSLLAAKNEPPSASAR